MLYSVEEVLSDILKLGSISSLSYLEFYLDESCVRFGLSDEVPYMRKMSVDALSSLIQVMDLMGAYGSIRIYDKMC